VPIPLPVQAPRTTAATGAGAYDFAGKFDLYIKSSAGATPSKHTVKSGSKKEISLQKLLAKCDSSVKFANTDQVLFILEKDELQIANRSKFEIIVGKSALMGGRIQTLNYMENVILTNDNGAELAVSPRFTYRARK
jgi:hypothetical protein